jgi:hypothetical protein
MSESSAWKVASLTPTLPGYIIAPLGGSKLPSGTNGTFGAHKALPSLRAIASHPARFT